MAHSKGEGEGAIKLTISILPKQAADKKPNGIGRTEPNQYPVLPEPTGRF